MQNDELSMREKLLVRVGKMRAYDSMYEVLESAHVLRSDEPECSEILGCLNDAVVGGASGDIMDIAAARDLDDRPSFLIAADWFDYFRRCGCEHPVHVVLAAAYHAGVEAVEGGGGSED